MNLNFGDIVLVNFDPSIGHEYKKIRPALVVQEKEFTASSPYVTVMPISSKIEHLKVNDVFIQKDTKNRLASDSVIKVEQISSFDRQRIIKKFGALESPSVRRIRGYLRKHFGL